MSKIELKYQPREQQQQILDFVATSIKGDTKFMMIDAPTGVGKSYAAVMIADWYRREVNQKARIDVLTNTKLLQDQYLKDFDFIADLKGKNNYWCNTQNLSCGDADLLNKANKVSCRACPYKMAKSYWVKNPMSLTNFHLLTSYAMYSEDLIT